jgi:hypothetical protein
MLRLNVLYRDSRSAYALVISQQMAREAVEDQRKRLGTIQIVSRQDIVIAEKDR